MSTWPKIARMGTMKIPPAIQSIPPSALAPIATANSQNVNPQCISRVSRSRSRCCSSFHELATPDVSQARRFAQDLPGVKHPALAPEDVRSKIERLRTFSVTHYDVIIS